MWVWTSVSRGLVLVALGAFPAGCAKHGDAPATRVASVETPTLTPASRTRKPEATTESEPKRTTEPPTECAGGSGEDERCYPPESFVEALCQGKYPALALMMFKKSNPWQHAWVKVPEVMPQNNFEGPVTHAPLLFSEEVVLLKHRPFVPIEGYSVDSPDRYDVLRLSGSCATLAEDEIRYRWAGPSRYAPVVWNWLDSGLQRALSGNGKIGEASAAQEKACSGRYMGGGDSTCQKATDALVQTIMTEVDAGAPLPTPTELPEWIVD